MFIKWVSVLLFSVLVIFSFTACSVSDDTNNSNFTQPEGTGLAELATNTGINLGAAVNPSYLNEEDYANALLREFNTVVAENNMKFSYMYDDGGEGTNFDFTNADTLVNFAKNNNMKIRGHVFLWHNDHQIPKRIKYANGVSGALRDFSDMQGIIEDHIDGVLTHYQDDIYAWDVANEILIDDQDETNSTPELRNNNYDPDDGNFSVWADNATDDSVIKAAFVKADAKLTALGVRDNVSLFLCDYSNEQKNHPKGDAFYELVADWVDAGVPIDGVGFQMHLMEEYSDPVENASFYTNISDQIDRFQALGLEVQFTEIDIRINTSDITSDSELQDQAESYVKLMQLARDKGITSYLIWGVTDKYSWIPGTFSNYGDALLLDDMYNAKPAYTALQQELATE